MMKRSGILGTAFAIMVCVGTVMAGDLDSPAGPTEPGSAMYTLEDVYNRLDTGASGAKRTVAFSEPTTGPAGTGHTLDDVMAKAPATNANPASSADVLTGKAYWGLTTGQWGQQTGAMPMRTLSDSTTTVQAGYYAATNLAQVDTDLMTGNIKAGTTVFGVTGKTEVVDTSSGDATASEIVKDKKAWVDGSEVIGMAAAAPVAKTGAGDLGGYTEVAGEDGNASMRKGVAWPNPRFTDNGDGTVTDNLTRLIWLKNANVPNSFRDWATALSDVAQLNTDGTMNGYDAGDTSNGGSHQADWRLPNVQELQSLIDYGLHDPTLCDTAGTGQWSAGDPFNNVESYIYWSSTTYAGGTVYARFVNLRNGYVGAGNKTDSRAVWPVRGP